MDKCAEDDEDDDKAAAKSYGHASRYENPVGQNNLRTSERGGGGKKIHTNKEDCPLYWRGLFIYGVSKSCIIILQMLLLQKPSPCCTYTLCIKVQMPEPAYELKRPISTDNGRI